MVPSIFNYLRLGGNSTPTPTTAPAPAPVSCSKPNAVRALPGSWYTSEEMYALERRAIFCRKWLLITHKLRLAKPGDWLPYDVANIDFVLYCDDAGQICGARNTREYSQRENGERPVHIHIDCNGFIWVNLDSKETPEVPWEEDFDGIDCQERYQGLDFKDYDFDHSWEMQGDYNWKILSDNYNECYHCMTTHPDLNAITDLHSYRVETDQGWIKHFVATKPEQEARGLRVHPTYFFPSTSMNVSKHFFMLQRFIPHGPVRSTMRYEVYRNKNSPDEDFRLVNEMYKRVMSEDKALCELAQRNVNAGIFINGEMHPRLEKGPLFFQKLCRENVMEVYHREQAEKKQQAAVPAPVYETHNLHTGFNAGSTLPYQNLTEMVAY